MTGDTSRGSVDEIRVLVVDDEPGLAELIGTHLERADDRITATAVDDADDGLAALSETPFDCIVSDYDMPGLDGIEFLDAVRADDPDVPFILFTGQGSESVASRAFSAGATDYLQKGSHDDQYALLANRVTKYVERARATRQRERQLAAIESAHEGIGILDSDGRFRYVNRAYADLYGYDPDELVGESWELLYPDGEVPFVENEVLPAVESVGEWSGETTGLRADGSTFIEEHSISSTDRGDLVCTVVDITDWKQRAEERERYETLVEVLDDPVYILGPAGRFMHVNDAFVDLVGYEYETILGSKPTLIKSESMLDRAERQLGRLLSDDGPESITFEVEIQPKDGDPIPCEDHMGVLPYAGEEFRGSVGVLRDLSARHERDRELREHRALLGSSLDSLDDVFFIFGADGEILRWNERLNEITGYTDEEIEGMSPVEFFPDEHAERIGAAVQEVFETGRAETRADYLTKDGTRTPYEFKARRLDGPDGDVLGFAGIGRDISETLAYERRLERQNERLEEFASLVSHDLRNPLNVAEGRLELARMDCESDHLDAVAGAHDRMDELIEKLLELAQHGEIATDLQSVSLSERAKESWMSIGTDDAELTVVDEYTLVADGSRLQQLLENLFRNAVEHGATDDGTGARDVQIRVGTLQEPRGFYVADDGPGIPETEREHVFENGYSTGGAGIGAGLSIVKRVAEAHGWSVTVTESRAGGARFEITGVEDA